MTHNPEFDIYRIHKKTKEKIKIFMMKLTKRVNRFENKNFEKFYDLIYRQNNLKNGWFKRLFNIFSTQHRTNGC